MPICSDCRPPATNKKILNGIDPVAGREKGVASVYDQFQRSVEYLNVAAIRTPCIISFHNQVSPNKAAETKSNPPVLIFLGPAIRKQWIGVLLAKPL
jgi:hypothetical protein